MSDQETVSVKLVKLHNNSEHYDILATLVDEYDKEDYLYENKLTLHKGDIWQIKERVDLDYSSFTHIYAATEDEIEFIASYYNGGCCLAEVVEDVLKDVFSEH